MSFLVSPEAPGLLEGGRAGHAREALIDPGRGDTNRSSVGGYGTILILFVVAAAIGGTLHFLASALGPRAPNPAKAEPFECGNLPPTPVPIKQRLSVKFYVVALLFIVFDMETVFLFPWAVIFRELGWAGFVAMLSFVGVLALGLVYVWKKGALDWE